MKLEIEELKKEVLEMVDKFDPCEDLLIRVKNSKDEAELLKVIYDNLDWCSSRKFLTNDYFNKFDRELFINSGIANTGVDCTGFSNSGNRNSGDCNSGDCNSGDRNSGNRNSGDCNSGYRNSGDRNSGDCNSGDFNSGDWNSGDRNSGDRNSGDRNSGDRNSGDRNSGDWNSGDRNSGDRNSGDWNRGDRNSGDCNSGYRNSGVFCSDSNPKVWMFDKQTDIYVRDWENSRQYKLMSYGLNFTFWINSSEMTEQEKKDHPKYETTGGYLKHISHKEGWINFWGNLSEEDKKSFTSLPNFDTEIFFKCTGIKL